MEISTLTRFGAITLLLAASTLLDCGGSKDKSNDPSTSGGADVGQAGDSAAGSTGTDAGSPGMGGTATGGAAGTAGTAGAAVCTGTPSSTCEDRLCDTMPGCSASDPAQCSGEAEPCSSYDDNVTGCSAQWGCGEAANGVCAKYDTVCSDYHSEAACVAFSGCWWSGLFCNGDIISSCPQQTKSANCESNPACFWTAADVRYCGGSATPCGEMTSDTCEMQTGCTLEPATCDGTPTPCGELSRDDCLMQPGCSLVGGGTHNVTPTGISTSAPDLIFESLTVKRGFHSDQDTLDVYLAEINRGTVDAPGHSDQIILSKDETYGNDDDFVLTTASVDFVIPAFGFDGAVLQSYFEMPSESDLEPGYYYPIGVLDSDQTVRELEKANNVQVLPSIYVGPNMFDLAAVSLTSSLDATAAPDDSFDLTLTVSNNSTASVPTIGVATYLSEDENLDDSDVLAECTDSLDLNLDAGGQGDFQLSCTVPRVRGTYYVLTVVDPEDTLGDADRSNNVAVAPDSVSIDAPSPDLEIADLQSDSYAVDWQGTVALSATVSNTGSDPSPATTVAFLLNGTNQICSASVEALDAGASTTVTKSCTLGASIIGTRPLSAYVDPDDQVFEVSETNNTTESATDLVVAEPDINLVAAGVGIVAGGTTRSAGDTLEVYPEIENDGTVDAPPYRFIFYASTDTTITTSDFEFCIRDATTGQAAGTTTSGAAIECQVPTMDPGDYYIGLIVDTDDDVPETDESDNVAVDSQNLLTIE